MLVSWTYPSSLVRNFMSSQAARCLAGSLANMTSAAPEFVGSTVLPSKLGICAARRSHGGLAPVAPLRNVASAALLSRIMPISPRANAGYACSWESFGVAPDRTRSCAIVTASTAGGSAKVSLVRSVEITDPPLESTRDW